MTKIRVTFDLEYQETHGLSPEDVAQAVEYMLEGVSDGSLSLSDYPEPDYEVIALSVEPIPEKPPAESVVRVLSALCKPKAG